MYDKEVKKNDRIGIIGSVAVHALLLLLFLVIIAWQYPDPPPPTAPGMEIALGFEEEGRTVEEVVPQEVVPEVVEEEVKEEVENNTESPEVIEKSEEKPKEVKEKVEEKPKEEVPKKENLFQRPTKGDSEKEGDKGDPRSLMKKSDGTGNSDNGSDKGSMGNSVTTNIKDWKVDNVYKGYESKTIGFVKFRFVVDEDGKIISITRSGGANLSPSEENFYKKQLLDKTFIWPYDDIDPPARTTGEITINARY